MSHDVQLSNAAWRRPDAGTDAVIAASWLAVLALVFGLLRPAAQPEAPAPETAAAYVATDAANPAPVIGAADFHPFVRPGEAAPAGAGIRPWSAPDKPQQGGLFTRLSDPLNDPVFTASNHGNAGSFYGGDWLADNVSSRNGGAFLEVKREEHGGLPYTAAEMQSGGKHHYGRYETIMQPARGSGLVSAFFTYTGPWFGDPHDEIDIEFLGSDTTRIHFNYFRDGRTNQPATFDLPFDAASRPRLYAFEWRPDGVTWFVEGVPVYATQIGDPRVPAAPGKLMISAWTGNPGMAGWHGKPLFRDGAGAQFNCVSFTPRGHDTPACSDIYRSGGTTPSTGAR